MTIIGKVYFLSTLLFLFLLMLGIAFAINSPIGWNTRGYIIQYLDMKRNGVIP